MIVVAIPNTNRNRDMTSGPGAQPFSDVYDSLGPRIVERVMGHRPSEAINKQRK
jgi:hypothetical protein